jgi:hypothetical protein
MREAIGRRFERVVGMPAEFTFSGWGYPLPEKYLAVVESRMPDSEMVTEEIPRGELNQLRAEVERLRNLLADVCEGETAEEGSPHGSTTGLTPIAPGSAANVADTTAAQSTTQIEYRVWFADGGYMPTGDADAMLKWAEQIGREVVSVESRTVTDWREIDRG